MKTVILCGGMGTRLREETEKIPKPLIPVDDKPILWHIIKIYSHYDFNEFVLCLGYKGNKIKEYFVNYDMFESDITVKMGNQGSPVYHNRVTENWEITMAETGLNTGTAGRIKRVEDYVGESFFMTYGDGVADVNINELFEFHKAHGKIATVTAVRPLARFGMLDLDGDCVTQFKKFASPKRGWIDGGFFVFNRQIFDYLADVKDEEMLEGRTLENLAKDNELMAFKHGGYWRCIDTFRDVLQINKDIERGEDLWRVWQ